MKRTAGIIAVLAASGLLGWLVYRMTDSTTAAYIVSCAGTAVGIAALFLALKRDGGIDSRIKIKNSSKAEVAGVSYSGSAEPPEIKSDVDIGSVEGGKVTGVQWRKPK